MSTNDFLKDFPPETHSWAGLATFSLGYPHEGWIILTISCTAYVQDVSIDCSEVFDPFPKFIAWLESIMDGRLPSETSIDEEGYGKALRASPVTDDEFLFEVVPMLWSAMNPEDIPIFMYVVASKKQFIAEFLKCWDDFIVNKWNQEQWRSSDLTKLDVSKLRKFVDV